MADTIKNTTRREARLRDVPLDLMQVNPAAQREFRQAWADEILGEFDIDSMQTPHANHRDGLWWIMDGQHSIAALKLWLGDWKGQRLQCWTYEGLSEEQEADKFLRLNFKKTVPPIPKFRAAVTAGRPDASDINRIVLAHGCKVTSDRVEGAIRAVAKLESIYQRSGAATLGRTLRIIRDAYGDYGLEAPIIDGIGLLCQRYNGELNDDWAVSKLSNAHGGVAGLTNKANVIRQATGLKVGECHAIAAVEIINSGSGKGGPQKLPRWRGEA